MPGPRPARSSTAKFVACLPPGFHAALAAHFSSVHLVDSTAFDCPACLAALYPGCGSDASTANVKLLPRYDYLRRQFVPVALVPGKCSDQGLTGKLPALIRAGELLIADQAFVKLQTLRELQQAGAYFLLPGPRALGLWPPLPGGASGPPTGTAPQRLCPHQPAPLFQPHPLKPASVETYWL